MQRSGWRTLRKGFLTVLVTTGLALFAVAADEPGAASEPTVTIVLGPGQATATPWRQGSAYTGGGNIHVTQPSPDTVSVTMTGVVAAKAHPLNNSVAHFTFDLSQSFEVAFHSAEVKGAKLILWGRTVGLLRSNGLCGKGGWAEVSTPGHASVSCGPTQILALSPAPRAAACGENLSVHDREGPFWVPVGPGKYTLHQVFGIMATHGKGLFGKPVSAEFAPDPALEESWLGKREPFQGAVKKDFGFQVILKVVADEEANGKNGKAIDPGKTK